MNNRRCPGCGEEYEYRLPTRYADRFGVTNEYRCELPQHDYVYFHEIPPEQVERVAYGRSG